jgi:hypothetical protein
LDIDALIGATHMIEAHCGNVLPTKTPVHLAGFMEAPPYLALENPVLNARTPSVTPTKNVPSAGPSVAFAWIQPNPEGQEEEHEISHEFNCKNPRYRNKCRIS